MHEPKGFFFGNFSLPSKKNCPAQYEDKLKNKSLFVYCAEWHSHKNEILRKFLGNKKEKSSYFPNILFIETNDIFTYSKEGFV